jgi:hypothetical protein
MTIEKKEMQAKPQGPVGQSQIFKMSNHNEMGFKFQAALVTFGDALVPSESNAATVVAKSRLIPHSGMKEYQILLFRSQFPREKANFSRHQLSRQFRTNFPAIFPANRFFLQDPRKSYLHTSSHNGRPDK